MRRAFEFSADLVLFFLRKDRVQTILILLHVLHQSVTLPKLLPLMLQQSFDLLLSWTHVVDFAPAIVVQVAEVIVLLGHLLA